MHHRTLKTIKRWSQSLLLGLSAAWTGAAAPAVVSTFTGGDPGEGLDLQGSFLYAVNVSPGNATGGQIGDAFFTGDAVPGVTVTAVNSIAAGGWGAANFGADTNGDGVPDVITANDKNLSFVMNSIRWTASPGVVTVKMKVTPGAEYKLQILQRESCCPGRGFNVVIDGVTEVESFKPGPTQAGDGDFMLRRDLVGAVITKQLVAATNELVFVLDGAAAPDDTITDRNSILNGFTLERISAAVDSDNDGMPDDWENANFGGLAESGTGDADSDSLTNAQEYTAKSNPKSTDSDGDGLTDGAEVNTHKSNPLLTDSDVDHLKDGDEVNTHQTDPAKSDTDGDTFSDYDEVRLLTNPKSSQSKPKNTLIGIFRGADPGEGLDLQGTFPYAVDFGSGVAGGQVANALFTDESADGVTVVSGNKTGAGWNGAIVYGETVDDQTLAEIMSSISWSAAGGGVSTVTVTFTNLSVGAAYKLQMLFAEQQWPRGFDISVNGAQVADDFSPAFYQGGGFPLRLPSPDDRGVVVTHSFIARTAAVTFVLNGNTTTTPEFTDHNAIINAATLELVAANADSDNDTLPDPWEIDAFGNLAQTASGDPDQDSLPNGGEFTNNSDPNNRDTDADGLTDGEEVNTHRTSPVRADTDGDTLTDIAEINTHKTDPAKADSDNDRLSDAAEVNVHLTNAMKADTDDDGVSDFDELRVLTDPNRKSSVSKTTTVGIFTGADSGEGLDFQGNFIYAFSVGTENAAGRVGNANFTGQTVDGVTILGAPSPIESWHTANYGDTADDDGLEAAIRAIRHGGGGARIILTNLIPGALYKAQMLFAESCCARAMDIMVDGRMIVDEFAPFVYQGGPNNQTPSNTTQGAAVIHMFIAKTNWVELRTVGGTVTTPAYTDRNPIINAVTLEEVSRPADTDNDTLLDSWESLWFGNLAQTGTADPDNDTLTNKQELDGNSDPNQADADADTLNDAEERAANTDPYLADTDGDRLRDDAEVKTHRTNPRSTDTDSDGRSDFAEVSAGTDPLVPFMGVYVGSFSGGDPGEGLDFEGTFVYAFDVVLPTGVGGVIGKVGNASFTEEDAAGITLVAQNNINAGGWGASEYGDTANDDFLELVMQSIRWSAAPAAVNLSLANLTPGKKYKLQLLFYEQCCARGFDVNVEGTTIVDDFAPYVTQGGIGNLGRGAVVAQEFIAADDTLNIELAGATVTTPAHNDHNAILNGVTLEDLGTPLPPFRISSIVRDANGIAIAFVSETGAAYTLEYKASLSDAAWQAAGNITATGASTTIRDNVAAHRTAPSGFWRIRKQ